MITDEDRREVARRLRGFVTDGSVHEDVDAGCVLRAVGLFYKDVDRLCFSGIDVARLADLIDPGEPKVRCVAEVKVGGERLERLVHDAAVELSKMRGSTDEERDAYNAMLEKISVELHPVDRDALLELAGGLEADADRIMRAARSARFGGGPRMGEAKHDAYEWRGIARRIREALGADDG